MIEWVQSWSMVTWAFAIGASLLVVIAVFFMVGRETFTRWVEALYKRKTGA